MSFFSFGSSEAPPLKDTDGVSVVLHKVAKETADAAASATRSIQTQTFPKDEDSFFNLSWYTGPDPVALLLEAYTLSLVTAPLVVVETLQELQLQSLPEEGEDTELDAYDAMGISAPASPSKIATVGPLKADVWANVRTVASFKGLGTLGLVKGHFTTFLHATLTRLTQPFLEEALNDAFDVFDDAHPATALVASASVAALLSPLELIRTRLIAQAPLSVDDKKRYYGPFHAAAAIHATEELYPSAHLYPTIVCRAISSLLQSLSRNIIMHDLGLHPDYNPLSYTTAVLVFLAAEVFVITPFELARKRIQVQTMRSAKMRREAGEAVVPFASCVDLSHHKRYTGILDVIRRVITEESVGYSFSNSAVDPKKSGSVSASSSYEDPFLSSNKKAGDWQDLYSSPTRNGRNGDAVYPKKQQKSGFNKSWDGLRSLYRGYWTRYSIRVVEFAFEGMRDVGDSAWDI
ncbi:UNVERIFIED_CONTAM: hypothetical protein HDU68_000424 [Siphonaria sp. JEL0065]|nr:hypothetical protein HDU68_000424 [Siphonaria sp. JEL0065]